MEDCKIQHPPVEQPYWNRILKMHNIRNIKAISASTLCMLFVDSYEFSFSHDVLRGKAFELGTQQINYVQNLCCSLDSLRVNY
jgi:hypothetical protein